MSIHELPKAAVRIIGSSQTLSDPASVVKELIDNAIDARASSVFVEISANALDVIQVRDTGHGVAPNDRPLVARRYCTSKIRNEKDLTTIGGSYLGFRGEALSSAAEMSAAITITTRIEGEDIATAINIASNGKISAQEPASHPVGTTVRVTDFLSKYPVRKQIALKCSMKTIGKIKQILQTYAFARPTTRLSLRVMKAKSDRDNWTYAPKAGMDMEETAMKVLGKACASQCAWYEVTSKGFQIHAFVPRSNAEASKIGGIGQYLSVDGRPVSANRGLFKQIVKSFKADLQKVVVEAALIKEPFMYMAISCPEGSYDPNIEPAKDDVLFEDADAVLAAVQNLLDSAYPVVQQLQQSLHVPSCMEQYERERAVHIPVVTTKELLEDQSSEHSSALKSNMYDMDEDDLQLIASMADEPVQKTSGEGEDLDEKPSVTSTFSNPWIMAEMNGRIGKTNLGLPGRDQLITVVKESSVVSQTLGSPTLPNPVTTVLHARPALPSPRASSPLDCFPEDPALFANTRSVRSNNLLEPHPHVLPGQNPILNLSDEYHPQELCAPIMGSSPSGMPQQSRRHLARDESQHGTPLDEIPDVPQRRRDLTRKAKQQYVNKPFQPPRDPERDAWFDVPEARYSRRTRQQKPEQLGVGEPLNFSQPRFLSPPPNNRDIRTFIGAKKKRWNAVEPDVGHAEHAAVDIEAINAPINGHTRVPTLHPSTCDFVSASELDLVDSTSPSLPLYTDRQPSRQPRRRRTGERTFVDVTGNSRAMADDDNDKDPSREPRLPSTTSRRQRTKDGDAKPHRTKSSQLPLERVPPDLYMQNVVLPISTVEAQLELSLKVANANANGLLLRWNEPACGGLGLLDRMLDVDVDAWAERLSAVLEMRFPSSAMVGDLKDMLKLASRRTDCMV